MGAIERVVIPYAPRQQFRDYHARKQRWAVIVAHRRAGKTVATINDIIKRAIENPLREPRYAYIAPFFVQAKDIAWTYLRYYTQPLLEHGGAVNESELRVTLPHGASIRLYGADNYDRLRGLYFDGVVLDEYADMPPSLWGAVVRPTLSDRGGWATFIGTPKGYNSFYDIWNRAQDDPEWFSLRLRASETGILDAKELEAAHKDLADEQYQQEYETDFSAANIGAILGRYVEQAEKAGRIRSVPYDRDGSPVCVSSDIGFRDTATWWFWQPTPDGYKLIDYEQDSGLDAEEWAKRIAEKDYRWGTIWLPHDAAVRTFATRRTAAECFQGAGFHVAIVPMTSVADRINAARLVIPSCWFDAEHCAPGLAGLRQWSYDWDEELRTFSKTPKHDWASHPGDGFSYGAQMMQKQRVVVPPPKPVPKPLVTIDDYIAAADRKNQPNRRI